MALQKSAAIPPETTARETKQDAIEQLRVQVGMLTQEVSSYKHLLEDLLKNHLLLQILFLKVIFLNGKNLPIRSN